jgi:hypothetical protein
MKRLALITLLGVACSGHPAPAKAIDPEVVEGCLSGALQAAYLACWSSKGPNGEDWPLDVRSCMTEWLVGDHAPPALFWRCTYDPRSVEGLEFDPRLVDPEWQARPAISDP